MTHGFAVLIGFVRPIPDVATFATPIFVDDAGNHLVQHEIGGCITAFQPVNVGEEFEAITFKIAVHVGDAALYSFEMRTGSVLIGPASLLGRTLTTRLLDATNADANYSHTVAAVRRFVEFSRGAYSNLSSGFPCLIELTRQGAGEPFYLSHVLCGQPALGTRMYAEGELLDAFTPTRWETEIFNLLSSPHTPEPDSLDHTSQYIESLISQFPDRGLARTQFRESLDNVFRMWWPSRPKRLEGRHDGYLTRLLDLATAYMPRYGFERIVELFTIPQVLDTEVTDPGHDLRLNALHALQRYFPAPPFEEAARPAFEVYVKLLWSHAIDERYASHCTRVLMELGELSVQHPRLNDVLKSQPTALLGILEAILGPNWDRPDRDVMALYDLCFTANLHADFQDQLSRLGGEIDFLSQPPLLRLTEASGIREFPLLSDSRRFQTMVWQECNTNFGRIVDETPKQYEVTH